jgi:hypothetical protein
MLTLRFVSSSCSRCSLEAHARFVAATGGAMSEPTTTQWLTLREAAKRARCWRTTISRAARGGELKGYKRRTALRGRKP